MKRIRELDFIRGIAILLVAAYHCAAHPLNGSKSALLDAYVKFLQTFGPNGVDLFFALSGFLVGGLLIRELAESGKLNIGSFIIRRIFKIWPLYYCYLAFIVVTGRHPLSGFLVANIMHVQNYFPTSLEHTWSLAVEEHFYLLLPVFLSAIWDRTQPVRRLLWATAGVFAVVLVLRGIAVLVFHQPRFWAYTHTRLDSLMAGVMLSAVFLLDKPLFEAVARRKVLLLAVVAVGVLSRLFGTGDISSVIGGIAVYSAATAFIIFVLSSSAPVREQFWYKAVSWIGLYSYGIFLWHNSVRETVAKIASPLSGLTGWFVIHILQLIAGILLGVVASRVVEWPFLRLREKFFARPAPGAALPASDSPRMEPAVGQTVLEKASNTLWPRQALFFLGICTVSFLLSAWYSLRWNPEIRFYDHVARLKAAYASNLKSGPKAILLGDSNCAFSLNPEVLRSEFQISSVNAGLAAGMGAIVISEYARSLARTGDTIVISLAPNLLTQTADHTGFGVQFSYTQGHPEWVTGSDLDAVPISRFSSLLQLRPGAQHVFALTAKALTGRTLYRYSAKDVDADGWMHTDFRRPIVGPPGRGPHLSGDGLLLLRNLRAYCEAKHIRLVYSLPWGYVPLEHMQGFQRENREFLREISAVVPVLRDPQLGAWSDVNGFSDTTWHLAPPTAALRTRAMGRALVDWDVWKPGEL